MSLIQEALKRQQEEQAGAGAVRDETRLPEMPAAPIAKAVQALTEKNHPAAPPPPLPPAAPPPGEDDGSSDEPAAAPQREKARPLTVVLGVVLLLLLLLGGGAWAIVYGIRSLRNTPPVEKPTTNPPPLAGTPRSTPLHDHPTTTSGGNPPPTLPGEDRAAGKDPASTVEQPAVTLTQPATTATSAPTIQPPTPQPLSAPSPQWPYLALTGVVGRNDSGAAMINRQIVDVGSAIEGVTVIGIERNAAWLEYKGDRRLLHVGKSTE
jgi:hypothetical protein